MGSAMEAVAEDDIRVTIENRLEEGAIILRVVFEVGILDEDHLPRHMGDRRANGSALAEIPLMREHLDLLALTPSASDETLEELPSPVHRAIIHENQFHRHLDWSRAYPPDDLGNRGDLIVDWYDHRKLHAPSLLSAGLSPRWCSLTDHMARS